MPDGAGCVCWAVLMAWSAICRWFWLDNFSIIRQATFATFAGRDLVGLDPLGEGGSCFPAPGSLPSARPAGHLDLLH